MHRERLTDDEMAVHRNRILRGESVSTDGLPVDQMSYLDWFKPSPRRPTPSGSETASDLLPDRLKEYREKYDDGERYLRHASVADLLAAVGPDHFDKVMRERAALAARSAREQLPPAPPPIDRDAVRERVLALHARGVGIWEVSRGAGVSRVLAQHIIDTDEQK